MELEQALTLLQEFGKEKKLQPGALNLVEALVKNNVPVNQAEQFCIEHFMMSTIAEYYKEFFNYVSSLKSKTEAKPETEQTTTVTDRALLESIDSTLKEILTCLKNG